MFFIITTSKKKLLEKVKAYNFLKNIVKTENVRIVILLVCEKQLIICLFFMGTFVSKITDDKGVMKLFKYASG